MKIIIDINYIKIINDINYIDYLICDLIYFVDYYYD